LILNAKISVLNHCLRNFLESLNGKWQEIIAPPSELEVTHRFDIDKKGFTLARGEAE